VETIETMYSDDVIFLYMLYPLSFPKYSHAASGILQKVGVGASVTAGAILYLGKSSEDLANKIRNSIQNLNQ
jgi:hypothetical protein